jgi:hypothetical protein
MAWAVATKEKLQGVGMACVVGKYTNTSSGTGGVIASGLSRVVSVQLTGASSTTAPYVSSISGGAVTIVTASTDSGYYAIYGV